MSERMKKAGQDVALLLGIENTCLREQRDALAEALEMVPPLLIQLQGFARDVFGGPSSLSDCLDIVLLSAQAALALVRDGKEA